MRSHDAEEETQVAASGASPTAGEGDKNPALFPAKDSELHPGSHPEEYVTYDEIAAESLSAQTLASARPQARVSSFKRYLYTVDPALNITNVFLRTAWSMSLLYVLPALLLPLLGVPGLMSVGAGATFMTLVPELVQSRSRRELGLKGLLGSLGVLLGSAITISLQGLIVVQIAFYVCLLCLPFLGARYFKKYWLIFVNALVGATLMSVLIGNYLPNPWTFFWALVVLILVCQTLQVLVFSLVIRRPEAVLQSAMRSLYLSHEQCARVFVRYLQSGSKRHWRQLQRVLARVHKGAVALEAAMVECPGFPAELGESLHHCAYDTDLILTRVGRVVGRLMPPGVYYANPGHVSSSHAGAPINVWVQRLCRRVMQIFELQQNRDPGNLELATELVGELRGEITHLRAHLTEEEFSMFSSLPLLLADLLSETIDGGMASAEADAWLLERRAAKLERALARIRSYDDEQERGIRARVWRRCSLLRRVVWKLRMIDSNSLRLDPCCTSWVPVDTSVLEALRFHVALSRADSLPAGSRDASTLCERDDSPPSSSQVEEPSAPQTPALRAPEAVTAFSTGLSYADLRHSAETLAAHSASGEKKLGPLVIGLSERQALQTFFAVGAASVFGWLTAGDHFFWASFGAYVVLMGTTTTSSRYRKMIKRVVGTAEGAVLGLGLNYLISLAGVNTQLFFWLAIGCTILSAALAFTVIRMNYTVYSCLLTALVMQIYLVTAQPLFSFAVGRVLDNLIGSVIAVVVAQFVFPLHTSAVVQELMVRLARALHETLSGVEKVLLGEVSARPRVSARQVEYAGNDIRNLAAALLGPFISTSDSWIRRVAARLPAVINSTTQVASSAGDIRDDWDLTRPIPEPSANARAVASLAREVGESALELLEDQEHCPLEFRPDRKLGDVSALVFESRALVERLDAAARDGEDNARVLREIVHELATLDAALKKLQRARQS